MSESEHQTLYCRRCKYPVVIPTQVSKETAAAVSGNPINLIKLLRDELDLRLIDGKALVNHVTRDGSCLHCSAVLPAVASHVCDCRGVNVNLALLVPRD
jgi:hypothetical protein